MTLAYAAREPSRDREGVTRMMSISFDHPFDMISRYR